MDPLSGFWVFRVLRTRSPSPARPVLAHAHSLLYPFPFLYASWRTLMRL